jgi:hypothetical protein
VWPIPGENRSVRIFAGKDRKEGGTWFGISEAGLVVGVTNRYTGTRHPDRASRGQLVLRCLAADSIDRVLAFLTPDEVSRYNPFNLFCLSEETGVVITHDDQRFQVLPLAEGTHILTNRPPDDPQDLKRQWLQSRLRDVPSDPDAAIERFSRLLASHGEGDSPVPVCVHLPGYGTVSSFLAFLASRREQSRFLCTDGSPCQNELEDLTPDLQRLFAPGGPGR